MPSADIPAAADAALADARNAKPIDYFRTVAALKATAAENTPAEVRGKLQLAMGLEFLRLAETTGRRRSRDYAQAAGSYLRQAARSVGKQVA